MPDYRQSACEDKTKIISCLLRKKAIIMTEDLYSIEILDNIVETDQDRLFELSIAYFNFQIPGLNPSPLGEQL